MRRRTISIALCAAIALGAWVAPASAAVTATAVTAPADGTHLFSEVRQGAALPAPTNVVFSGTATISAPTDTVDLRCVHRSISGTTWNSETIAINVATDDATGAWTTTVNVSQRSGSCLLRAIPGGAAVPNDLAGFTGPTITLGALQMSEITTGPNKGGLSAWFASAGQSGAFNRFGSPSVCSLCTAELRTGLDLRASNGTFNASGAMVGSPGDPIEGGSGITVDGLYAYLADGAAQATFGTTRGDQLPGWLPITVERRFDAATGALGITETLPLVRCTAGADQPRPGATCTAFASAGISLARVWSFDATGRVVRVTETWSSTDGAAHALRVQFIEASRTNASFDVNGAPTVNWTSRGAMTVPTSSPWRYYAKSDRTAPDGDVQSPQSAGVFTGVPTSMAMLTFAGAFGYVQPIDVPAGGSTVLERAYTTAPTRAELTAFTDTHIDLFVKPTVAIAVPGAGARVTTVPVPVSGTATDNVGIASITLNGVAGTVTGDTWTVPYTPTPGANTITVVAKDAAGNEATATTTFTSVPITFNGTPARDVLRGNRLANVLNGFGGNDLISCGAGGKDRANGGTGNDVIGCVESYAVAKRHRDVVNCGPGRKDVALVDPFDVVRGCERVTRVWNGGRKADRWKGSAANDQFNTLGGNDRVSCGGGIDRASLGFGNDLINCRDFGSAAAKKRKRDTINCGAGRRDVAIVDRFDRVRGCERVIRRG